jgi:acetamidase/formamidase
MGGRTRRHTILAGVLLSLGASPLLGQADVDGRWNCHYFRFGQEVDADRADLKSDGTRVTGALSGLKVEGTIENDRLRFTATRPDGTESATYEGRIRGDEIEGTVLYRGEEYGWKAWRAREATGPPKTHVFVPTEFHRVFSGAIEPVLRINPGDTVKTTTIDAGGRDAKDVPRSMGGNPQTGPFYVEDAMPGDTLVVKLGRVRLSRDSAGSHNRIVPTAVQPRYYRDAKFDDGLGIGWKLDREAGVGMLAGPTERMRGFRVKLQPFLGCVGVAPPGQQAFFAGWPGSWGGNLDYSGVREGTTVYLPVYREGALLFVGDGHALQGDGELNGNALETSMDVEFTVDLIRGQSTQGPRFEDDEHLMASGIAGSLQEALQQATTELALWLERDYGLSANESNIVLGTSIRYEIAEVVNPHVHIVAKVSKAVLATLR